MTHVPENAAESGLVRVSSDRISRLMDLVGELSLTLSETLRSPDLAGLTMTHFDGAAHRLTALLREVQDATTDLRLVPLDEVFRRLRRMVRELERQTGKQIALEVSGGDIPIDKLVADRLHDPLMHVLRNCIDHGLEPTAERRAAGKPEQGRIQLSAAQVGSELQITVADDGRGLSRDRILRKARERGFFGPAEEPDAASLWKVIFQPGFSTAEAVSNLSGRGVGMDVLNAAVTALRGWIGLDSAAGQGTRVTLHIPTSLAFLDCIILRLGRQLFALPINAVAEIIRPGPGDIIALSGDGAADALRAVVQRYGRVVPLIRLDLFYGRAMADAAEVPGRAVLVVAGTASGPIALPVDEVLDRQQVVMKPLTGRLSRIRASSGCALLATGEVAVVLDCERLSADATGGTG